MLVMVWLNDGDGSFGGGVGVCDVRCLVSGVWVSEGTCTLKRINFLQINVIISM